MNLTFPNITLGTAGHIDHGKTALVRCLTGCETDRLKEEKDRGMSIDLGFAPCVVDDMQVGIVDVPGHEDFIKTMVAGATGMDGVLLVVAADDGVMPQTREHLDILTLLGISHGLVVLTKIDRVSSEEREAARSAIEGFIHGTFLEGAPILPVSNINGEGFDGFAEALAALVRSIQPKPTSGVFRLPVERVFSATGYGTVVSGIPVSGCVQVGDELSLLPDGMIGQVRKIEVYGRESETCLAGQCAALAVRHWDHTRIARGDVAAQPGYFAPADWLACSLRLLSREHFSFETGTRVKLHTGTSEVPAALYLLESDRVESGWEGLVQVKLGRPVVAGPGDRFILRSLSPVRTIGGGTIIEPIPRRLKRTHTDVLDDLRERLRVIPDEKAFVEYCVREFLAQEFRGQHEHAVLETPGANERDLAVRVKLPLPRLREILAELVHDGKIVAVSSDIYLHAETAAALSCRLLEQVAEFHKRSPESPGIAPEELLRLMSNPTPTVHAAPRTPSVGAQHAVPLQIAPAPSCVSPPSKPIFDVVIARLRTDGKLVERNKRLALAERTQALPATEQALLDRIEALFRDGGFHPPDTDELVRQFATGGAGISACPGQTKMSAPPSSGDRIRRALKTLTEHERLIDVGEGILFHRDAVDKARGLLVDSIRKNGSLESVKFKYLLDTTRKYAIPLLDHFDRVGLTINRGHTRYLKPGSQ